MAGNSRARVLGVVFVLGVAGAWLWAAGTPSQDGRRAGLMKTYQAGNYRDAYEGLKQLALDPHADPHGSATT